MKTDYRVFQVSLLAMAPIHIGSGEKYTSREFIYENHRFYFPDMGKFYNWMIEKGLDRKFEQFLQETRPSARNNRLISFLNKNGISERSFGGYSIAETGLETEKNNQNPRAGSINEVAKFMRDAFGNPYIPGSSLKGAIRTILMNTNPDWNNKNAINTYGKFPKENKNLIPWGAKKGQDFDDLFNAIRVSDSKPLSNSELILAKKWDLQSEDKEDKKENKPKPIPLYREAIVPLTRLTFTITTTTQEAAKLIEELGKKSFEFYNEYKKFFLEDFPENMIQSNIQYPIYLGAGSGAWTKTLFNQADGILQARYRKKPKMYGKGVLKLTKAPIKTYENLNKLIQNDESFYEMGKANFMIKEIIQ